MSEEFFVLIQKTTSDVLGVFSRRDAVGSPTAADVASDYLQLSDPSTGAAIAHVPAGELDVKPTEYDMRVIVNPLLYQWQPAGVLQKTGTVSVSIASSSGQATVGFPNLATPKAKLWIRIEGPGLDQPFTQSVEVTGVTQFITNPAPFQQNKQYGVACFVEGQLPLVKFKTAQ